MGKTWLDNTSCGSIIQIEICNNSLENAVVFPSENPRLSSHRENHFLRRCFYQKSQSIKIELFDFRVSPANIL